MKKIVKEYEIDSFEKLCNLINDDNFQSLTSDLIMWLGFHVQTMKYLRDKLPKSATKGKTNWDLCKSTFIWIDDGKNEMKFLKIHDPITGEVKTVEFESVAGKESV